MKTAKNLIANITLFILEIFSLFLFLIFVPVYYSIRLLCRKSTDGFFEKSGFFKNQENLIKNPDDKLIMFHGVSVGEVIALENLIKLAKETFKNHKILITTGTKTGQDIAKKKYAGIADFITFFPFDIPLCTKLFFKKIKPDVILMAETELWPFFALYARKNNIPLLLINGRISDDSFKTYRYFGWFFKYIFNCYTGIYTQSKEDMEKMVKIGAPQKKTEVMKNLKFDIQKNTTPIDFNKGFDEGKGRILIAGSTHKGEDEIVLKTFKNLKSACSDLKLIIAPRHLTRVDSVSALIKETGFKFGLRSKKENFKENDILLLDTLGELSRMYSVADIAFIGGSFNNTGGHNPLEAIIYSKPVVSGPSIKNFKDIYGILTRTDAAKVVKTQEEMEEHIRKLLFDDIFYAKASADSTKIFESQKGAKDFVINKMQEILKA
ncbi:MAG: 3-deoxy-D-manno-octulosonic acid transferase [Candidatus Gastranaerophilales bacterium]|nr:3-deoxy-D-manno-octulosonic acid transferase [Candidatus Gastranaerophilales bacterium]